MRIETPRGGYWVGPGDFDIRFVVWGRPIAYKTGNRAMLVPATKTRGNTKCPRCHAGLHINLTHSKAAAAWYKDAVRELKQQWPFVQPIPVSVQLEAEIISYMPTKQYPDLSASLEGPQDALMAAGIIEDDGAIVRLGDSRIAYDKNNGRVEVRLRPYKGPGRDGAASLFAPYAPKMESKHVEF